jgi:hypothetical protein
MILFTIEGLKYIAKAKGSKKFANPGEKLLFSDDALACIS